MICTSIRDKNLEQIAQALKELEMAEIRLDLCPLDDEDIEELFSCSDVPLIATCRIADPNAERKLRVAIEAGAKYVDLEMEAPPWMGRSIRQACRQWGTVLIRSYHDFKGTPPWGSLLSTLEKARNFGGEIVKIATTALCEADVDNVLRLYQEAEPGTLVAFCMGKEGHSSRLEALRLGAPFTYACLTAEESVAPGQWTVAEMREAVYGGFRFIKPAAPLTIPASKSFAQRAILAAALADGVSHLSGYSPCGDNESAIGLARSLGAAVDVDGDRLTITGIAAAPGAKTPSFAPECGKNGVTGAKQGRVAPVTLNTGESGLLTRLTVPVMAAIGKGRTKIEGEGTLLGRPLSDAHDILASFGVRLYSEKPAPRPGDCMVPLEVAGPLLPGRADVSGRGGSQLISGLLYALPLTAGKSTLYVHEPKSIPYLFITVDVLKKFGIRIGSEMEGGDDFLETQDWGLCSGITFKIPGPQRYAPADFAIEADWSGAAPLMVAGAIFGEVEVSGLDTRSLQADISIMDILMDAGASMSQDGDETGPIHISRAPLNAFETDLNNCPDLFPIVSVLAAFCPGESHIMGVERLRHKETDRAAAIEGMLTQMGVEVSVDGDCMTVAGMSLTQRLLTDNLLKGGSFTSHGDHRMVMALRVAALGASAPVIIDDTACVAKSFPSFNELFDSLCHFEPTTCHFEPTTCHFEPVEKSHSL
ncbi:MAG: type I 3-dehydroquinate dehydratase [Bacteroidales bacterium]|nr:type I 3-dehydroquinate dehydratase [Bacteroidales bacterium]